MNQECSLVSILRNDPDFSKRLAHVKKEVEKDIITIKNASEEYSNRYKEEVLEGTKKMQKLLSEGESMGLTEEEVISQYGKFCPTVRTPILNMLFFILRESEEIDRDLYQRRNLAHQNKKYIGFEEEKSLETMKEPDDMFCVLYGNRVTMDTFNKLKKLKTLTLSKNIEESTLAFQKCRELCERHNIDYEKVPMNVRD